MAFNRGPKIVTQGLVLALDAASKNSYPGTGTTWKDLSGNNNTGTLVNSPTFNSANGGSIVFNGSNQYTNCGNPLTFTDSFTISSFFKTTAIGTVLIMGMYSGVGGSADWWIGIAGPSNSLYFSFGSPSKADITSINSVNNGVWYNASCVYNKSSNSTFLYINSILNSSGSVPATVTQAGGNLMIGTFGSSLGFYFPGNIANTQIYNRALTAAEIAQNYNATKSRFNL